LAVASRKWWLAAIAIGLTPVTRPEAVVVVTLFTFAMLWVIRREWSLRQIALVIVPWIPVGLWAMFCRYATGHWMPNTYYVKAHPFSVGSSQLLTVFEAVTENGLWPSYVFFVAIVGYVAWSVLHDRLVARWSLLFLVVMPLAYLFGVAGTRDINLTGYYWTRWVDPASLVLNAAVCMACAILFTFSVRQISLVVRRSHRKTGRRVGGLVMSGLGLAALLYSVPSFLTSFDNRRGHIASDSRAIRLINVRAGEWVDNNTVSNATIGVNDAGAIRYFGKRRTIDLVGLNYADIAFKKASYADVLQELEWLAVFPDWFRGSNITDYFEAQTSFQVPLEEYTICPCPGQTTKVILKRRATP